MHFPARPFRVAAISTPVNVLCRYIAPLLIAPLLVGGLLVACGGGSDEPATPTPAKDTPVPSTPTEPPTPTAEPTEPPPPPTAPLTGEFISEEHHAALATRRPLAVMMDNIITATPQSGIDQADVVIEALVEGGITRYMAIFHSKEPEVIEPVRSARTPFVQWAAEYDALYVHVGSAEKDGPADAGQQIRDWGIMDMDLGTEAFNFTYVRDPNRSAPHNVLTSAAQLRARATELGLEGSPIFGTWRYSSPEGLVPGQPAPGFSVWFGPMSPRYSVRWDWNAETLRYERSQFGEPQFDAFSGNRIAFANVIVQYAGAEVVDSSGHVLIENIGEGPAQVFTNGQLIDGTWRKADLGSRTEFFDWNGNPIPLMAGTTWIEVVPPPGGAALD